MPIHIATSHKTFLGAEADLIRNIHGVAEVTEVDGEKLGYLLAGEDQAAEPGTKAAKGRHTRSNGQDGHLTEESYVRCGGNRAQ